MTNWKLYHTLPKTNETHVLVQGRVDGASLDGRLLGVPVSTALTVKGKEVYASSRRRCVFSDSKILHVFMFIWKCYSVSRQIPCLYVPQWQADTLWCLHLYLRVCVLSELTDFAWVTRCSFLPESVFSVSRQRLHVFIYSHMFKTTLKDCSAGWTFISGLHLYFPALRKSRPHSSSVGADPDFCSRKKNKLISSPTTSC